MKTIKNSKDITTLEIGDKVIFDDLEYKVKLRDSGVGYYLYHSVCSNNTIFLYLHLDTESFCNHLGISILNKHNLHDGSFPETKSLEALTAIVSALFKKYEKQNELPKTWEEFCEKYPLKEEETFINTASEPFTIGECIGRRYRIPDNDKNLCTSKSEAEAFLALMQLRQLRKCYVGDWEPDLTKACFGIVSSKQGINVSALCTVYRNLSFSTYELAEQFLTNFKDLLEIAKPLL